MTHHIRNLFYKVIFAAISCLAILTSCISPAGLPVYPSTWPALMPAEENSCPIITGKYSDSGILYLSDKKQEDQSFSKLLFGSQHDGKIATRVEINQVNDSTLEISVWSNDELIHHKQYSRDNGEFGCMEKYGLTLSLGFGAETNEYGWGMGWKDVFLNKSIDNSLIMRISGNGVAGILWIIPAVGGGHAWYRFEPVIKQ